MQVSFQEANIIDRGRYLPYTIINSSIERDVLFDLGVSDKIPLTTNSDCNPFAISGEFNNRTDKWKELIRQNCVEPFAFYKEDNNEFIYIPLNT